MNLIMKRLFVLCGLLLGACAEPVAQDAGFVPLYVSPPAESNGLRRAGEIRERGALIGGVEADYALFLPGGARATGQAVVVCPGGGYAGVAYMHEGVQVGQWLAEQGVAAVVLRYRMPNGHDAVPLADVHEAIRMVRSRAGEWGVDPGRVGVMGFSAGGHLAATAATHFDAGTRPDFAVLIYPVITMDERLTHRGSRDNLLGTAPDAALVARYSNERQVTPQTPRVFIALSDDDTVVDPRNSTLFYDALRAAGVPGELHIYPSGGHGWGWLPTFRYHDEVTRSLGRWLRGE